MDISVKKLSEILKIDPNALLEKMIAAGLSQTNLDDLVSTEDKQKLLSFIRSAKDSPVSEKKVEVPKELEPQKDKPEPIEKPNLPRNQKRLYKRRLLNQQEKKQKKQ